MLFAETNFIEGVVAAVIALGGAFLLWYQTVRKASHEEKKEETAAESKERDRSEKAQERRDKKVADEYRALFIETKQELNTIRKERHDCDKRVARLEAALIAAKIPLPPMPDDEGSGSYAPLAEEHHHESH